MSEPVIAVDQFFLLSWITAISNILPPLVWGFIFLAALWSLAWLHTKAYRERKSYQLRYKIMAILVLVVIGGIGYFSFNQHNRSDQAVVMVSSELHIAPDPLSQLVKNIEGGEKVLLLDTLEGFYKVRLVNYEVGWIPIGAVKII